MLYLQLAAEHAQGVVDHHVVGAELQRYHEDQQNIGKDHCQGCQPGTAFLTPDISPGKPETESEGAAVLALCCH
jgi:hypothetical protein